jgi:hypothetical protein
MQKNTKIEDPLPDFLTTQCTPSKEFEDDCAFMIYSFPKDELQLNFYYFSCSELLSTKRKSFAFGYCLSTTTTPQIVDFDASGMYGGIINNEKRLSDSEISLLPSDLQLVDHHKYK